MQTRYITSTKREGKRGKKDFTCTICFASFEKKYNAQRHLQKIHNINTDKTVFETAIMEEAISVSQLLTP